jgi:hypothetical protein
MGEAGDQITAVDGEFNIFVKHPRLAAQWTSPRLFPQVKLIARTAAVLYMEAGRPFIITEIHRADGGVHSVWRALDARSQNLPLAVAENIRGLLNRWFVYGLTGKGTEGQTVPPLDHPGNASKSSAPHLHIQIPARHAR